MDGVRIIKKSVDRSSVVPCRRQRDYEFFELVKPIAHLISGLYWILEDADFRHVAPEGETFDDFQYRYDELIIAERSHLRITSRDFILRYAKFISGDWDNLTGVRSLPAENAELTGREFIEQQAIVNFQCIDALYWEVYAPEPQILATLRENFDYWEPCKLGWND
jgi:hypothetical protein